MTGSAKQSRGGVMAGHGPSKTGVNALSPGHLDRKDATYPISGCAGQARA
jgi:hypothetical protein